MSLSRFLLKYGILETPASLSTDFRPISPSSSDKFTVRARLAANWSMRASLVLQMETFIIPVIG